MTDTDIAASTEADWRQARLIRLIEDHAHRFHEVCPGSEARYVLEGWINDATPAEREFVYAWVKAHPELFTTMPRLSYLEVADRNDDDSRYLDEQAAAAFKAGDYDLALYLLDAANWTRPGMVPDLDLKRGLITRTMAAAASS